MGRFDYPSPYWDSVGDSALDLIDRMLTVNVEERISIDECLEHPWTTRSDINPNDSTDGLTGAIASLDFSKRKVHRERTLLSSINDITLTRVIEAPRGQLPIKLYEKNKSKNGVKGLNGADVKEATPSVNRHPEEFIHMGGKGDEQLYEPQPGGSVYPEQAITTAQKEQ
jgi:serine/threonine-protein kinase Chk2